jgi:hypothetical protein
MRLLTALLLFAAVAVAGCGQSDAGPRDAVPDDADVPKASHVGEMVESPSYKLWARFPVGTSVTQRTTTENARFKGKTVTTIVYTVKENDDDHVTVETQATTVRYHGVVEKNPAAVVSYKKMVPLPEGFKKEDWGKPTKEAEAGEEEITVLGKAYKTKWAKRKGRTDAGQETTQTWTSDEMPGGLVKSVTVVPKVQHKSTVEVIKLHVPKG